MASSTAPACAPATSIDAVQATGTGSVAVSSPTVFNFPRPPANDSGRLLALASLVGGFLDAILGGDGNGGAVDAEAKWKDILDNVLKAKGTELVNKFDPEMAKTTDFAADLRQQWQDYRTKADNLWPMLAPLHQIMRDEVDEQRAKSNDEFNLSNSLCTADALAKLCEFVTCGYRADYDGIATRVRADAEQATLREQAAACRVGNRYNMRRQQYNMQSIRMATASVSIGAIATEREKERRFAWDTNYKMRGDLASTVERIRMDRRRLSLEYDKLALDIVRERWTSLARQYESIEDRGDKLSETQYRLFFDSAFKHLREGGEMLAAAGQAYQFLAASIRATAKQGGGGGGGIAGALATMAVILPAFSGKCGDTGVFGILGQPETCCAAPPK